MIRDVFTTLFLPRHDLKLVELQPEDSARMLDEGAHAQGARGCPGVQGGGQVPNLKGVSEGLHTVWFIRDTFIRDTFIGRHLYRGQPIYRGHDRAYYILAKNIA